MGIIEMLNKELERTFLGLSSFSQPSTVFITAYETLVEKKT